MVPQFWKKFYETMTLGYAFLLLELFVLGYIIEKECLFLKLRVTSIGIFISLGIALLTLFSWGLHGINKCGGSTDKTRIKNNVLIIMSAFLFGLLGLAIVIPAFHCGVYWPAGFFAAKILYRVLAVRMWLSPKILEVESEPGE